METASSTELGSQTEEGAFGDKEEEHTMPKTDLSFECVSHQFLSWNQHMSIPVEPPL